MNDSVSNEAATRAAALLDAAPGIYGLRKRERGQGRQPAATSSSPTKSPKTSPDTSMSTMGPVAASTGGEAREAGTGEPSQVDANQAVASRSKSLVQPAPVISTATNTASQRPQTLVELITRDKGSQEEQEDDGESSLTSLSDLEERFSIKDDEGARAMAADEEIPPKNTAAPRKRQTTMSSVSSQATSASPASSEYRPAPESDHDDDVEAAGPPVSTSRGLKSVAAGQDAAFRPSRSGKSLAASKTATSTKGKTPVKARKALSQSPVLSRASIKTSKPVPAKSVPLKRTSPIAAAQPSKAVAAVSKIVTRKPPLPSKRQPTLPAPLAAPVPRFPSDFRPGAMPLLAGFYDKRKEVLAAIREAGNAWDAIDGTLQARSERQIESALEALGPEELQRGLCLIMNRYSAFCAISEAQLQPFPITAAKVALFLGRSPATLESSKLRAAFPQPPDYPLPVAGFNDVALKPEEGSRVSRELVRFWIEALDYAQRATSEIWAPFLESASIEVDGSEAIPFPRLSNPSLGSLADDAVVHEIVNAIETSDSIERSQERAAKAVQATRQLAVSKAAAAVGCSSGAISPPAAPLKGSTKWTKGGRAVAPPPSSKSSSSTNTPNRGRRSPEAMGDARFSQLPGQHDPATSMALPRPQSSSAYNQALAMPGAPVGLGIQHLPVASSSRLTLDQGHRRRSTTSDLMQVDAWGQPAVQTVTDERPVNLPTPLSMPDAPFSSTLGGGPHDLSAWAQHYLQQTTVDGGLGAIDAPNSLSAPEYTEAVGQWTTTLPDQRPHFTGPYGSGSSSGRPSISEVPAGYALQQDNRRDYVNPERPITGRPDYARLQANGATPGPSRASSIDMLAAVATSYAPDVGSATMDWGSLSASVEGLAGFEHFGQPEHSANPQPTAVHSYHPPISTPWQHPLDPHRGGSTAVYDSGSGAFEAASSDFLGQDSSLLHFLHARSQSHPPAYATSASRYGHIVDQALGSLADAPPFDSLAGAKRYPPAYPTPDSPTIERWRNSAPHVEPYQPPRPFQAASVPQADHLTPYASAPSHYAFPDTSGSRSATAATPEFGLDFPHA